MSILSVLETPVHLRAHRLRDLDGERTDVARRAIDEDLVARLDRSAVAASEALKREDGRVRKRGRLLERHAGRHRLERPLRRAHVLGEAALSADEHVPEDLVTGLQLGDAGSDRLDDAGGIDADAVVPRRAEAHEKADEARPRRQAVEVGSVDRCGSDADQHLVLGRDRNVDVPELHDIGRTVSVSKGRLHAIPS